MLIGECAESVRNETRNLTPPLTPQPCDYSVILHKGVSLTILKIFLKPVHY